MGSGVVEDAVQQSAAPPPATMRRENVKTTQPSRGFILAVNAAYANQPRIAKHSVERLSGLVESIRPADPVIVTPGHKSKSFVLTRRHERFDLG